MRLSHRSESVGRSEAFQRIPSELALIHAAHDASLSQALLPAPQVGKPVWGTDKPEGKLRRRVRSKKT